MYCPEKIFTKGNRTGGILRFCELYQAMNKSKYNVDLCCAESQSVIESYGKGYSLKLYSGKLTKVLPTELMNWLFNRKRLREIRKNNYDMIISFDVPQTIQLVLSGYKNIVMFLRQDLIEYRNIQYKKGFITNLKLGVLKKIEQICLKSAKHIFVQCQYDLRNLVNRHTKYEEMVREKTTVQINNVNPSWIISKSEIPARELKKKELINICFIGNFNDSRKGHKEFLTAVSALKSDNYSVQIIGNGNELPVYENMYKMENFVFWGRLDNPIEILKSCDLLIVPSKADSCPNTVLEALYNNIPVLGSNRGGIPEILNNEEELLFSLEDTDMLEKMNRYIENEEYRNRIVYLEKRIRNNLYFDWGQTMINHLKGIK